MIEASAPEGTVPVSLGRPTRAIEAFAAYKGLTLAKLGVELGLTRQTALIIKKGGTLGPKSIPLLAEAFGLSESIVRQNEPRMTWFFPTEG